MGKINEHKQTCICYKNTKCTGEYIFGLNEYTSKFTWHLKSSHSTADKDPSHLRCYTVCPSSGPQTTGVLLAWHTLTMKEICSSEMSGIIYQLTQCNNTKDFDLQVNWQQPVKVSSAINHVVLLLWFLQFSDTVQTTSCSNTENFVYYTYSRTQLYFT